MNAKVEKSKILDHVIVTETAIVEDVKGNIFLDYPPQTVFDEINASKQEIEKEKIDQGFLEEADRRLISLLESFFKSQGFEEVDIVIY